MPLGHLAVDCLILGLWLWHASAIYRSNVDSLRYRAEPALFFQEGGGSVAFNPRFPPPAEFLFLASGNPLALFVSGALRPEAGVLTPAKLWDPVWFLIHEGVSFLFWFGVGALLDYGLLRIKRLMTIYLVTRIGFAACLLVRGVAGIGWRVEVLSWMAFGVYAIVAGLCWLFSKARSRNAVKNWIR